MPSPVAGNQVVRVEFRQQMHGNAIWNVFHAYGLDTITDLATEVALMGAAWDSLVMPTKSTECTMPEVSIQRVWPDLGGLFVIPDGGAGGIVGPAVANQLALIVSHHTAFPGRRARGRSFLGGYPEANFDGANGIWPVAFANNRASTLDAMWNDPTVGVNWEPIVWSTDSAIGPSPQFYAIDSFIGRTIPGVIRSRRLGVGI